MKNLHFIQLDPRTQKDEQPDYDLGIEVTIPGMKNDLDHHGEKSDLPPAIQQVIDKIGSGDLKNLFEGKQNVILATVRPDLDSVGTMAVIKSDNEGLTIDRDLVRLISVLDQYGPLGLEKHTEGLEDSDKYKKIINAMNTIVFDFKKGLDEKVLFVQDCLAGNIDQSLVDGSWEKKVENDKKLRENSKITEVIPGELVFVESSERGALGMGYEIADTVIAVNESMPITKKDENGRFKPTGEVYKKYTIAKSTQAVNTDMNAIMAELNSLEAGRGGRGTIMGSPQNQSSELSSDTVIEIVKKHVLN